MRADREHRQTILLCVFGTIPMVWLALIAAPEKADGLPGIIRAIYNAIMTRDYRVSWCQDSLMTILLFPLCVDHNHWSFKKMLYLCTPKVKAYTI